MPMETMSFLLILAGVMIVGAVFAVRLRRPPAPEDYVEPGTRRDPLGLDEAEDWDSMPRISAHATDDSLPHAEQPDSELATTNHPESVPQPDIHGEVVSQDNVGPVVVHVMARAEGGFTGPELRDALQTVGMGFGDMNIFHYFAPGRPGTPPLFSLANMVKPGNFDLNGMDSFSTKGLALFMLPTGSAEDVATYDSMLGTAEHLGELLGGDVRDEHRSALTRQGMQLMREQLEAAGAKLRVST